MQYLHTMVRVKDLDASLDFYCDKLGLKEVRRMDNDKGRFTLVFLAAPEDEQRARADKAPLVELTYNWDSEDRSEEHTSELQSLMRISSAVFCLKNKKINTKST